MQSSRDPGGIFFGENAHGREWGTLMDANGRLWTSIISRLEKLAARSGDELHLTGEKVNGRDYKKLLIDYKYG